MLSNAPLIARLTAAGLTVAALGGCTSINSDSTGAAASSAAPSPMSTLQWCDTYIGLSGNLGSLGESAADAKKGLALLNTFEQLWVSAGDLGMITNQQVKANRDTVAAYREVMEIVANGGTEQQIRTADATFTALTETMREPLESSAAAVMEACKLNSPTAASSP